MSKTSQFELPLVAPAQAQKHVTVNEALARIDAVAQLSVLSSTLTTPPAAPSAGTSYLVPDAATGDWAGKTGSITVFVNGGWVFLSPRAGWRAWDVARGAHQVFDGTAWTPDAFVVAPSGAATIWRVAEFTHTVVTGASNETEFAIPGHAQVIGVTGRVVAAVSGAALSSWRLGVAGSSDRYGSGYGLDVNSFVLGMSGGPVTYYGATPLVLTAEGGTFAAGSIRIAVHFLALTPPRPV